MEKREFDFSLLKEMDCANISELAIRIHRKQEKTSKETVINDLKKNIKKILKNYGVRMNNDDLNRFTESIYHILNEIGLVLEGLQ